MKGADAKCAFENCGTNEVLTAFVGLRLRHEAYLSVVELPDFSAEAILRGQALADWRLEDARGNVVAQAQVAGRYPRD
jgi:hypothetical protein